jgi:hypothetical protein
VGTIDSTKHLLSCDKCNVTEERRILDKGSGWSGSWWQEGAEFESFNVEWSGGGKSEPTIVAATCRICGSDAVHSSGFGGL